MADLYVSAYLPIPTTEEIGPLTNLRTVAILHPDMHRSSETGHMNAGRLRITQRMADRDVYLPTHRLANMSLRNMYNYDGSTRNIYDNLGNVNANARLVSKLTAWDDKAYVSANYVATTGPLVQVVP